MRFDTVIRNGTVVTATDTCVADVGINGDKSPPSPPSSPHNATRVLDATGMLVIPGGIDVHTHLECPSAATPAPRFSDRHNRAAFGGTTTLIDFPSLIPRPNPRQAFAPDEKAHDKPSPTTPSTASSPTSAPRSSKRWASSSAKASPAQALMAIPGVFMLDDATIFKAMRQAAKHNGLICMHAETAAPST